MERYKGDTETAGLLIEQGKCRQAMSCVHYAVVGTASADPLVFDVRFHTHLPY